MIKFSQSGKMSQYDWKKALYTLGKLVLATILTFVQSQVLSASIPDITVVGILIQGVMIQQAINYVIVYTINRWFSDYTVAK